MLAFLLCGSVVNSCLKITRVENAKSHGLRLTNLTGWKCQITRVEHSTDRKYRKDQKNR